MEIKSLEKTTQTFEANGRKYIVRDKISIRRFKEYEKLVPQLTFGLGFEEMFTGIRKAFDHLNVATPRPLDAGIILHNLLEGIANVKDNKRIHPALKMAALVIDREDEDATKYDEQLMLEKIADWELEGFDMLPFFDMSLNSIQGFGEILKKYIQEREIKSPSQK